MTKYDEFHPLLLFIIFICYYHFITIILLFLCLPYFMIYH